MAQNSAGKKGKGMAQRPNARPWKSTETKCRAMEERRREMIGKGLAQKANDWLGVDLQWKRIAGR